MNWLDILLLCLAGVGFAKGLFDGVIKQVVSLIALLVGIVCCSKVADILYQYLKEFGVFTDYVTIIISYIVAFVMIVGLFLLIGELLSKIIGITPLGLINHLLGGVVGLTMMVIFMSLFLNLFDVVDKRFELIPSEVKKNSKIYAPIKAVVPTILPFKLFSTQELDFLRA